jgi:hypothetical protein
MKMKSFNEWLSSKNEASLGDHSTYNNMQLKSGNWAAANINGEVFVSIEKYKKGDKPERFKYEPCRPATPEERREYLNLYDQYKKNLPHYDDMDYEENHKFFNEVSPDLLNRASNAAYLRGDPRGERMASAFRAGADKRMERPFGSPRPSEKQDFKQGSFFLEVYFKNRSGEVKNAEVLVQKIEPVKAYKDLKIVKLKGNIVGGYGYLPSMGHHEGERPKVDIFINLTKKPFEMYEITSNFHGFSSSYQNLYISRKSANKLASELSDLRSYYVGEDDVFLPYRATDFQLIS